MSRERTIASLYARRRRLTLGLQDFERRAEAYRAVLAEVEAQLQALIPSVRAYTPRKRCPHFTSREFSRACQDVLREAGGKSLTTDDIAVLLMQRKGLDTDDGAMRKAMRRRVCQALRRMRRRGTESDYARDRCQ
jgi:hypothetical protein